MSAHLGLGSRRAGTSAAPRSRTESRIVPPRVHRPPLQPLARQVMATEPGRVGSGITAPRPLQRAAWGGRCVKIGNARRSHHRPNVPRRPPQPRYSTNIRDSAENGRRARTRNYQMKPDLVKQGNLGKLLRGPPPRYPRNATAPRRGALPRTPNVRSLRAVSGLPAACRVVFFRFGSGRACWLSCTACIRSGERASPTAPSGGSYRVSTLPRSARRRAVHGSGWRTPAGGPT
jgi:hypothetical protein